MIYVEIAPEILRWAVERSRRPAEALERRFPKLRAWVRGERQPTLKQLESFAKATRTPFGYLFLPEPPDEPLPLPDFRTVAGRPFARPSADLLETIYRCQERQDWYREFAQSEGEEPLPFVGSARVTGDVAESARRMRQTLGFDLDERRGMPTWSAALRQFIAQADAAGILVMVSGVVGSSNKRGLDPREFRGFALSDDLAPLVFVNGSDTKAAQMFTLAHELAHIWLGQSALSDAEPRTEPEHNVERWCNRVAAELLAPLAAVREEYRGPFSPQEAQRLARVFKVSTLVILRRIFDLGGFTREAFWAVYEAELERLKSLPAAAQSGGDLYATLGVRVNKRFARAVIVSTLEGQTLFRDAFRMLGIRKEVTFHALAEKLGYPV
ncbi:MAG: ImmA/IrrE family metallo-endopeptidase [Bryobacteraceae bacterium]|nr:ImmA/IrrE family metallo-endopeptidase [Bryobacteraceae bacterium]